MSPVVRMKRVENMRGRAVLVGSNLVATLLFLVISPLLARRLYPSGRGLFAMAQAATALAPILIGIGTKDAAGWAEQRGLTGTGLTHRLVHLNRFYLTSIMVSGAAVGGALVFVGGRMFYLGITCVFLALFAHRISRSEAVLGQWTARGLVRQLSTYFLGPAIFQACSILILAAVELLTPLTATLSLLLSVGLGVAFRLRSGLNQVPSSEYDAMEVAKEGRRWWPGLLASTMLSRVDSIFLALFAVPATLGIYSVASTASLLAQPVLPALMKGVVAAAAANKHTNYARFHRKVMLLLLPAGAIYAIVGYAITPIVFETAFSERGKIFAILSGVALFVLSANMTSQAMGSTGCGHIVTRTNVAWLMLSAILLLVLPRDGGNIGTATAIAVTLIDIGLAGTLLVLFRIYKGKSNPVV